MEREIILQYMSIKYVMVLAPVLFLYAIAEMIFLRHKKERYNLEITLTNFFSGFTNNVFFSIYSFALVLIYNWVQDHFAFFTIDNLNISEIVLVFLGTLLLWDHQYYWSHRMGHSNKFFWAFHCHHHQSQQFNLVCAFRNGVFQQFFNSWFFLPMAFLGIPVEMMLCAGSINLTHQFFIHMAKFPRIKWFESIFNSPNHHSAHHASNAPYLDKNFAGTFIIFDKIYGTFEDLNPNTPPLFGVRPEIKSHNPIVLNFTNFFELLGFKNSFKKIFRESADIELSPRYKFFQFLHAIFFAASIGAIFDTQHRGLNLTGQILFGFLILAIFGLSGESLNKSVSKNREKFKLVIYLFAATLFGYFRPFAVSHWWAIAQVALIAIHFIWLAIQFSSKEHTVRAEGQLEKRVTPLLTSRN